MSLTERSRNQANVFAAAITRATMTRGDLIADTGLSKATIARIVDDLEALGLLSPEAPAPVDGRGEAESAPRPASRGRRPTALTVPAAVGQVIGVSLGLQRTGVLAVDLAGRELSWGTVATPSHADVLATVDWLGGLIASARERTPAPLRRVLIAVPARVVDGIRVPNPPAAMTAIGEAEFLSLLTDAVGAEVVLDTDANMALAGLTAEGFIPDDARPLLLNMSTVLTMALVRRDGSTAQGASSSFGNFSALPFPRGDEESTLGSLLSTHGLEDYCARRGLALGHISELWGGDDELGRFDTASPSTARDAVVDVFAEALSAALLMVSVISDPLLVVLAGRLAPLAQRVLPRVTETLAEALDEPPQILVANSRTRAHTTSLGAAHMALTTVQRDICDRLANGTWARG
ncbi:ROK family transcriptional regulator [Microbacterium oxydans]|uniref:MarR family protein n=1 Tax=Microbacterium oxydans TaxID=82380 RepID=A0A0F0L7H3_9MICO|nr:ROK family transcriptional regulator [Microbacterium oxydans]KJL29098.1 MarR family protein [Microbacterium oxydans]